jgi:hypothetical protein
MSTNSTASNNSSPLNTTYANELRTRIRDILTARVTGETNASIDLIMGEVAPLLASHRALAEAGAEMPQDASLEHACDAAQEDREEAVLAIVLPILARRTQERDKAIQDLAEAERAEYLRLLEQVDVLNASYERAERAKQDAADASAMAEREHAARTAAEVRAERAEHALASNGYARAEEQMCLWFKTIGQEVPNGNLVAWIQWSIGWARSAKERAERSERERDEVVWQCREGARQWQTEVEALRARVAELKSSHVDPSANVVESLRDALRNGFHTGWGPEYSWMFGNSYVPCWNDPINAVLSALAMMGWEAIPSYDETTRAAAEQFQDAASRCGFYAGACWYGSHLSHVLGALRARLNAYETAASSSNRGMPVKDQNT